LNCQETQKLIHAYLDGELDLVKSLEIEEHLQGCPTCSQIYQNQQALRTSLNAGLLYFRSPAPLRKNIQAALRQADQPETRAARAPRRIAWRWAAVAASLVVVVFAAWGVVRSLSAPFANDLLAQEVVASHVRSLMPDHLVDVPSSDQHTVKPWFSGKLDFSPVVDDLANQGFPLVGGRLDYLDNRPVAALVYRYQQHLINLFSWPAAGASDTAVTVDTRQGYHVAHWIKSKMAYWAISDVNETELQQFVQLVQNLASP
jgi:anti-sigma factor RsiW